MPAVLGSDCPTCRGWTATQKNVTRNW